MNPEVIDNQTVPISQYYPVGIISQFMMPEQEGAAAEAAASLKPRRRRRKNKGDDGGAEGVLMRKRKLSEEQLRLLENSFGSEHKLESERKDRLAAELGLDPRQVAVWFQNRRARWKSKKLEEEYSKLKSQHETTVVEKCRLETELLRVNEQLHGANKEIQSLSERWERIRSINSPSSCLSMETMEPPFLGEFGIGGFEEVFYQPDTSYVHALEWDNLYYV